MGFNGLNHEHNWPSSVLSSKETDALEPSINTNWDTEGRSAFAPNFFGDDLMSSDHLTQSIVNPIWENTNGADYCTHVRETDSKLLDDFLKLEGLQKLQRAPSSEYPVTCIAAANPRLPETSNIKVEPLQIYEPDKDVDNLTVKQLHDGSFFSYHFEDPMSLLNGFPTGNNISVSTETASQASSAKSLQNPSKTGLSISEDVGSCEAIDGSFLTLGIGKDAVNIPARHFSNRDLASKLVDNFHPRIKRAHIQHRASSFPTPTCSPGGDIPSIQSNSNMWSSTSDYSGGCIAQNNDGIFLAPQTGLRTTPLHGVAMSQADTRQDFGANSYGNSGHSGNFRGTVAELFPYTGYQGFQAAHPLSYSEPFSYLSQVQSTEFSKLGPTSSSPAWLATQPRLNHTRNPQTHAINASSEAANCYRFPPLGGITSSKNFDGQATAPHKVEPIQASKSSISGNMQFQALPSAPVSLFPKRLAGQPSIGIAQAVLKGGVPQTQDSSHAWFPTDLCGPSVATGQLEVGILARSPQNCVMSNRTAIGKADTFLATTSDDLSLAKRRAVASVIPSSRQRRKIAPQNAGQPPRPHMHQMVPSSSFLHVPSASPYPRPVLSPASGSRHLPPPAALYIKRGNEGHLQPIGHNCLLCKRDLSFQPEGPVTQPSTPPAAVLPCGHVFHDHCLKQITPEDQLNDPPCIPCAIGEF
ncbi:hypothetical protein LIER_39018 [Lithospermum erythrorhizon]|uniref:RING-type domain-containing protein n=1 Tax=Lithospermum erythrorhizon TaxID=34254 RepID=A0AAV3QCR6_LITER